MTASDASGTYSYAFTPQVPSKYTIIATFEGSKLLLQLLCRNSNKRIRSATGNSAARIPVAN
jgi:hypothetical protein